MAVVKFSFNAFGASVVDRFTNPKFDLAVDSGFHPCGMPDGKTYCDVGQLVGFSRLPCLKVRTDTIRAVVEWMAVNKFRVLVGVVTVSTCLVGAWSFWKQRSRAVRSWLVSRTRRSHKKSHEEVRRAFRDMPIAIPKSSATNPHGTHAAARLAAQRLIYDLALIVGAPDVYFVQNSQFFTSSNAPGSHSISTLRDAYYGHQTDKVPSGAILALIDQDYSCDIGEVIAKHDGPTVLYTFQPTSVACNEPGLSFTFLEDGKVKYVVDGQIVSHPLWKYQNGTVEVDLAGFWYYSSFHVFEVSVREVSQHRALVLFTRVAEWRGPFSYLPRWLLSDHARIERLNPVTDDKQFTKMHVLTPEGVVSSVGRPAGYLSVDIPAHLEQSVHEYDSSCTVGIQNATTRTITGVDAAHAPLLTNACKAKAKCNLLASKAHDSKRVVKRYVVNASIYDSKPSMECFMNPIINGAFAPDKCWENDSAMIEGRITHIEPHRVTDGDWLFHLITYMDEFADMFCPPFGDRIRMHDLDEVVERQNRPSQRRLVVEGMDGLVKMNVVKSFMKQEAYGKLTDPRPISTLPNDTKVAYSQVIYSVSQYVKLGRDEVAKWYAFGMSPRDIAARVAMVCAEARSVVGTDMSRFDGHLSAVMRMFEARVLARLFHPDDVSEVLRLHKSQFGLYAYTAFGVKYYTGCSRASGSPETAILNSLDNAFIAYAAFRKMNYAPEEAYRRLGVYGGDDGLTPDVDCDIYIEVAKQCGQVLAAQQVQRGNFGVNFLSRQFGPDVWSGDVNSCCDLPRQMFKFHLTTAGQTNGMKPSRKLIEKSLGYYLMDHNTPVIGPFVTRVLQIAQESGLVGDFQQGKIVPHAGLAPWFSRFEAASNFPNEPCDWMAAYAYETLGNSLDIDAFYVWLNKCTTLEQLMDYGLAYDVPPKVADKPIVVSGDLVLPDDVAHLTKPTVTRTDVFHIFAKYDITGTRGRVYPDGLDEVDHASIFRYTHAGPLHRQSMLHYVASREWNKWSDLVVACCAVQLPDLKFDRRETEYLFEPLTKRLQDCKRSWSELSDDMAEAYRKSHRVPPHNADMAAEHLFWTLRYVVTAYWYDACDGSIDSYEYGGAVNEINNQTALFYEAAKRLVKERVGVVDKKVEKVQKKLVKVVKAIKPDAKPAEATNTVLSMLEDMNVVDPAEVVEPTYSDNSPSYAPSSPSYAPDPISLDTKPTKPKNQPGDVSMVVTKAARKRRNRAKNVSKPAK